MKRRPYGLAWRIALCRAVLAGHVVHATVDVRYDQRGATTTFVLEEGAVRRWRL